MVKAENKREFINWLLDNFTFLKEVKWILSYLMHNNKYLESIHFVDDAASLCPRGLIISPMEYTKGIAFRYYENRNIYIDPDEAFLRIKMNHSDDIYVQVNLKNAYEHQVYLDVLEENPYEPIDYSIKEEDRKLAKNFLEKCIELNTKEILLKQIDHSLDVGDRKMFYELTNELLKLEKNKA